MAVQELRFHILEITPLTLRSFFAFPISSGSKKSTGRHYHYQDKKILVCNWHQPPDTSNFLQMVGFSDNEFQAELQQFEIVCAYLNAHGPFLDPVVRSTERGEFFEETMLDSNGVFLITGAPTRQDNSTGGFSTPNVSIVHDCIQKLCDWSPCDSVCQ